MPFTRSAREDAQEIWHAAVRSVVPGPLVLSTATTGPLAEVIRSASRVVVVGAGKATAGMAAGLEQAFGDQLDRIEGVVNVPAGFSTGTARIRLHASRPAGLNEPTPKGVAGAEEMLRLVGSAGPEDVAICLLSGGASALLPAPVEGVTLADKLAVTRLLHRSGATIDEMNCVRKHLSRVKGGGLAAQFRGKQLLSLIISDVVGDPLDVIGSGPTAPDPTTFADAQDVIAKYGLADHLPHSVRDYLARGVAGKAPETLKAIPPTVLNQVIGSNRVALDVAARKAAELGYRVLDLGAFVEGETSAVATAVAGIVRSIQRDGRPLSPPACVLLGGETTVTLGPQAGKGGRNQEFVLGVLAKLAGVAGGLSGVTVLSGGTDGEDGPTDAAGAVADAEILACATRLNLAMNDFLRRHDAYPFFDATGDLLRVGLTGTNVMDVRVILVR